jgi:site-specific DNA-methyltransferase (adenine-specific)
VIELLNVDCMEYMRGLPDKSFELAIVDPPYGIGDALVAGGTWSVKYQDKGADWDVCPSQEYFLEIMRVAKDWIVWGGNYYNQYLPPSRCFISWVKPNMSGMHTMADCELALTSFDKNARVLNLSSQSNEQRIHVCQKPVKLYEWLLTNYAKKGDRILDTHLGSGSSAIAAHNLGFDFVGCELDRDYYDAAVKRFNAHAAQQSLFTTPEIVKAQQEVLL